MGLNQHCVPLYLLMRNAKAITQTEMLNTLQRKQIISSFFISVSLWCDVSADDKSTKKKYTQTFPKHCHDISPNNYIRVFHPEPGGEHSSIGAPNSDDRAALSSRYSSFQLLNQHCKICQGLLWGQVVQVFAVLQADDKVDNSIRRASAGVHPLKCTNWHPRQRQQHKRRQVQVSSGK